MTRDQMMVSLRLAGQVMRYHTWPMIQRQTVADHSWNVMRVYVTLFGTPEANVWYYIWAHDLTELWTGDIPYPAKARHHLLRQGVESVEEVARPMLGIEKGTLSETEAIRVKICDLLEMHDHGLAETILGNQYADPIQMDCLTEAIKLAERIGFADQVRDYGRNQCP